MPWCLWEETGPRASDSGGRHAPNRPPGKDMRCAATPRASGPPGDAALLHTCVLRTEQPLFSQKGLRRRGRVGSAGVRRGEFVHQMKKPAAPAKDAQVRGRGALSVPTSPGEEHRLEDTTGPSRPGDAAVPAHAALAYLRDDRGRRAAVTGSAQNQPHSVPRGKYTDLSRQTVSKRGLKLQETEET